MTLTNAEKKLGEQVGCIRGFRRETDVPVELGGETALIPVPQGVNIFSCEEDKDGLSRIYHESAGKLEIVTRSFLLQVLGLSGERVDKLPDALKNTSLKYFSLEDVLKASVKCGLKLDDLNSKDAPRLFQCLATLGVNMLPTAPEGALKVFRNLKTSSNK